MKYLDKGITVISSRPAWTSAPVPASCPVGGEVHARNAGQAEAGIELGALGGPVAGDIALLAEVLRRGLRVDRLSICRVDHRDRTFEVMASAGASLLVAGTCLPLDTSSRMLAAAEGRAFPSARLAAVPEFERPVDEVLLAAGFRFGSAVPIHLGEIVVGAVALSSQQGDAEPRATLAALQRAERTVAELLLSARSAAGPRVLLCHEDPLIGHGLARIVERTTRAVTRVVATLAEAGAALEVDSPDVVICDDHLGGVRIDGFAAALRSRDPGAPLLVVASHDTVENRAAAARVAVAGYVPRVDATRWLPIVLSTLHGGRSLRAPCDAGLGPGETLTTREREVLGLMEQGPRMKQVALTLGISETTAKTHARNVFRKLGASSRAEAVREARRQGVLG